MTSPSGEDSRSPDDEGRDDVVRRYRALRDDMPSDEWMAAYSLLNCLDLHSDRMWRHITSADKAKTMIETLLICLVKDRKLLADFVASSGNADIEVDSFGRVSRIKIEGRSYDLRGRMRNRFQKHRDTESDNMDMEEMESMIEREAALSAMISEVEEISDSMKSTSAPLETRMAVYGALSAVKLYYRHGGEDCALLARKALGKAFEAVPPAGPVRRALEDMERIVDVIGGWKR